MFKIPSGILFVSLAFAQSVGHIQGTVNDDSGHPVAGGFAVATLQSPTSHATFNAVTGPKGEFAFKNLPAGTYSICVHVPGGPHLNSCDWSKAAQVTVAAGQTLANQSITLTKGALIQVRLDDPNKILTPKDDVMIGVYLPSGLFQPMRLAGSDPGGRTYDIAVPLSTGVRLGVHSSHLVISDDKGKGFSPTALPKGNSAPTVATSGTLNLPGQSAFNGPPLTLTVIGRR
jgi:hypothetical protein